MWTSLGRVDVESRMEYIMCDAECQGCADSFDVLDYFMEELQRDFPEIAEKISEDDIECTYIEHDPSDDGEEYTTYHIEVDVNENFRRAYMDEYPADFL